MSKWIGFMLCALLCRHDAIAQVTNSKAIIELSVTPEQCVALRKGQTCYQEVELNWQSQAIDDFCLFNVTTDKLIVCWSQQQAGNYSFDFQSTVTHEFAMRQERSNVDLAKVEITLVWVYQSPDRPKARWRLF